MIGRTDPERFDFMGEGFFESEIRRLRGGCGLAVIMLMAIGLGVANAEIPRSARPEDPDTVQLYFLSPQDGDSLTSPVVIRFGLMGMGVAPAGVVKAGTGHHHLIVDAELPPIGLPIPATDHYRHFGMGQTEVTLDLPPGEHTLQLLLGDHLHIPHDPPLVSERISITVTK
jgi:hypothetical protein